MKAFLVLFLNITLAQNIFAQSYQSIQPFVGDYSLETSVKCKYETAKLNFSDVQNNSFKEGTVILTPSNGDTYTQKIYLGEQTSQNSNGLELDLKGGVFKYPVNIDVFTLNYKSVETLSAGAGRVTSRTDFDIQFIPTEEGNSKYGIIQRHTPVGALGKENDFKCKFVKK